MIDRIYGSAISIRNFLYDLGILKTYLVPPVVVSIGNIEAGGTGKTPFTMALAEALKARGHSLAIVTRGYRGRFKGPLQVMPCHDYRDVGDEPLLMARLSGVPVVKSPDRCRGAVFASRNLGGRIVLLDDGFQHRRIFRDVNICLASKNLDREKLLPSGRLREPLSSLKRADFIFYAGKDFNLSACGLLDSRGNPTDRKIGGGVLAFCGIANPGRFFESLEPLCAELKTMAFMDHHKYTRSDIRKILKKSKGMDMVLTTEKDMVRIERSWIDERFHTVTARMEINHIDRMISEIEKIVEDRRISRQG